MPPVNKRRREEEEKKDEEVPKVAKVVLPVQAAHDFGSNLELVDPYSSRYVKGNFLENWGKINTIFQTSPRLFRLFCQVLVEWQMKAINSIDSYRDGEWADTEFMAQTIAFKIMTPEDDAQVAYQVTHLKTANYNATLSSTELSVVLSAAVNFERARRPLTPESIVPSGSNMIHAGDLYSDERLDILKIAEALDDYKFVDEKNLVKTMDHRLIRAALATLIARHAYGIQRTIALVRRLVDAVQKPELIPLAAVRLIGRAASKSCLSFTHKPSEADSAHTKMFFNTAALTVEGSTRQASDHGPDVEEEAIDEAPELVERDAAARVKDDKQPDDEDEEEEDDEDDE